jgi:MFS-type transporter involved in bile tolerance (Atg22 family)
MGPVAGASTLAGTDTRGRLESTTFTPFAKLALAHATGVAGDVFVTISLADTLFFGATTASARPKVLLYLAITMAPFAVVAPVLGPALDRTRGGRRTLFALSMLGRGFLCILMANRVQSWMLYPLAFGVLVLSKGQSVAKSALVPAVVPDKEELVRANSRLSIIAIAVGAVVAPFAAAILRVAGAPWVLRSAVILFVLGTLAGFNIPRAKEVGQPETPDQRESLSARSIVVAGSTMALLRGVVGFFTFFAAFELKKSHESTWVFGVVIVFSAIGNAIGTVIAPLLRKKVREEWILAGTLIVPSLPLVYATVRTRRAAERSHGSRRVSSSRGLWAASLRCCIPVADGAGSSSSRWRCSSRASRTSVPCGEARHRKMHRRRRRRRARTSPCLSRFEPSIWTSSTR